MENMLALKKLCTDSNWKKYQHWEEVDTIFHPNQNAIYNCYLLGKEDSVFSNKISKAYRINPMKEFLSKPKLTPFVFGFGFVAFGGMFVMWMCVCLLFCLEYFCLIGFKFICFIILFFERLGEK